MNDLCLPRFYSLHRGEKLIKNVIGRNSHKYFNRIMLLVGPKSRSGVVSWGNFGISRSRNIPCGQMEGAVLSQTNWSCAGHQSVNPNVCVEDCIVFCNLASGCLRGRLALRGRHSLVMALIHWRELIRIYSVTDIQCWSADQNLINVSFSPELSSLSFPIFFKVF